MPDLKLELKAIRHVASLTGLNITNIRPAYPELGSAERGLDVLFDFDGSPAGAQHTTFHSDEGHTAGVRGSPTRAKEERIARATQKPFFLFGKIEYRPALRLRVDEKIAKAAAHDNRHLIAETWLVISANVGEWGPAASTMIVADVLCADDLNALCHAQLDASIFECACLVLHSDRIVWGWDRPSRWRVLANPGARERQQHREEMGRLIFDQIPAEFRRRRNLQGSTMNEVDLEETEPVPQWRRVAVRDIDKCQPITYPPKVIVFLKDGSSFICTRQSFDRAGLTLNG
jgi:hypothetical protein